MSQLIWEPSDRMPQHMCDMSGVSNTVAIAKTNTRFVFFNLASLNTHSLLQDPSRPTAVPLKIHRDLSTIDDRTV